MGSGMTTVGHTPQTDRAVQHAQQEQEQGRRKRQGAQGQAAIVDVAAAGRASAAAAGSSEAGQVTAAVAGGGKQKAKQKQGAAAGSGGGGHRKGKSERRPQQQAQLQPPMDVDAELERWLGEPPEQRLDDEAGACVGCSSGDRMRRCISIMASLRCGLTGVLGRAVAPSHPSSSSSQPHPPPSSPPSFPLSVTAVAADLATWGMHPKHHEGDMGHHRAYDAHWYSMVAGR